MRMDQTNILGAAFLGLIEGLTEYLPVSSTGHLILWIDLLGFEGPPGKVFEIAIQMGAILAIVVLYFGRLWRAAIGLFGDKDQRRLARNILLAFLPAMVLGALFHGIIKSLLFNPWVVSVALILGGLAILAIERFKPEPTRHSVEELSPKMSVYVGLCQAVAMIPGVSRAGATIMGAMLLKLDRKAATEFSFFLAVPTLLAATVYDLFKNRAVLVLDDFALIGVGFGVSFAVGLAVIKGLIAWVSRHDFTPFAYYRIVVGSAMLAILILR